MRCSAVMHVISCIKVHCNLHVLNSLLTIPCVLQYKFSCTNALVIQMHFSIFTIKGVNPNTLHSSLLLKCNVINMMQCMTYIHAALQKLSVPRAVCRAFSTMWIDDAPFFTQFGTLPVPPPLNLRGRHCTAGSVHKLCSTAVVLPFIHKQNPMLEMWQDICDAVQTGLLQLSN